MLPRQNDSHRNSKITHLPVGVVEAFPSLIGYSATLCSIKIVSKENFVGLKQLKYLSLDFNQIEQINSETFGDLVSLEVLRLGKNFEFSFVSTNLNLFQAATILSS
jgi:Leucine-rich repeat (LRR) protein